MANKQDMATAMSVAEVHQALGLDALKNRTFQIFKTSALKGDGLSEAMDWYVAVNIPTMLMNEWHEDNTISLEWLLFSMIYTIVFFCRSIFEPRILVY